MKECRNCQAPLDDVYCGSCGQRDLDLERPIWNLVADVLKETFEVDGRAWVTIETLFRYPGKLTSEFLAGRRRTYTSLCLCLCLVLPRQSVSVSVSPFTATLDSHCICNFFLITRKKQT